jgi:hypothetical protein
MSRVARFFWCKLLYMGKNIPEDNCQSNIPNGIKRFQIAIKYTNIFFKALQNVPKLRFLV